MLLNCFRPYSLKQRTLRMAFPRRLFSIRAFAGLLLGMVLGFFIGSVHFALIGSQSFSISDALYSQNVDSEPQLLDYDKPPCNHVLQQDKIDYIGMNLPFPQLGFGGFQRPKRSQNDLERDFESLDIGERLSRRKDIEKVYEGNFEGFDFPQLEGLQPPQMLRAQLNAQSNKDKKLQADKGHIDDSIKPEKGNAASPKDGFLYVGVLTAGKYVNTRGKAIQDTWTNTITGRVEYFVGDGAVLNDGPEDVLNDINSTLSVVKLKNVDDNAYPPQKKSFMMLKYMHDHYLNDYEWFMRADDDVYIKAEELQKFLRNLNSSEPIFIGQAGLGNNEEQGMLSLNHGENYCMGGPGMIFSREVLRRMIPNVGKCIGNMYTTHEDVEIGRCVRLYANVSCVWSYEMKELFYEHYSQRRGYIDPSEDPHNSNLFKAFTLHPNKNPIYQRKLHNFMLSQKIKTIQTKIRNTYRDIVQMDMMLDRKIEIEAIMIGRSPTLTRYRPPTGEDIIPWSFLADRMYQLAPEPPRRGIPQYYLASVKDIMVQIISNMNSNSKVRGRIIEYKKVNYGYARVNPLFGCEYVLDILLNYNRYRGKRVSLAVRRHAYLQQTFARTEILEEHPIDVKSLVNILEDRKPGLLRSVVSALVPAPVVKYLGFGKEQTHVLYEGDDDTDYPRSHDDDMNGGIVESMYNYDVARNKDNQAAVARARGIPYVNSRFITGSRNCSGPPTVNIIVPLTGRFIPFQKFMLNLEAVALKRNDPVSLIVMLFVPKESKEKTAMRLTQQLIIDYKSRYPRFDIRYLPIAGSFSRGLALEIGSSQFDSDALLFFCDVDVVFSSEFIRKCRTNTVQGVSVYYPVLLSEFDPSSLDKHMLTIDGHRENHYKIDETAGYWRSFGYGLLCIYQSDFVATGGFNTSIKGWGLEDVDLYTKFVTRKHSDGESSKVTANVMRVKEPHLIHVYHPVSCDPELSSNQMRMCQSSKASGISSIWSLAEKWFENQEPARAISRIHPSQDLDIPVEHQAMLQDLKMSDKRDYRNSIEHFRNDVKRKDSR